MMKRVIGATLGLLALTALPAAAADISNRMPVKAPIMAPAFSWTGFYIGGNVGAAIDSSRYNVDPAGCFLTGCGAGGVAANGQRSLSSRFNRTDFTGGGQIGYNWQFSPSWVLGLEADLNYIGTREDTTTSLGLVAPLAGTFNTNTTQRLDYFGTVRGRLGWLPADRVMIYATGGLAYGRVRSDTTASFTSSADTYAGGVSDTRVGYTVGGGLEYAVTNNWTVKAEYLFVDLGRSTYADPCLTACGGSTAAYTTDLRTREHIARVGVNYLFNAGPIMARY